ncbi:hypothetical protein SAMN05421747_1264 [Parapedobacter composti]|uniref:Uncharacterized protein n=1 Tax=Parapedobacter composti TaxID=623281 RepID=A0A1I1LZ38_9SPHI|nr:hypothetical protein [Parapedobacter composti]SFC78371.1 hypothetical protein SAMN05421747_1264 [Parapedobacter composti]
MKLQLFSLLITLVFLLFFSCRKTEYRTVDKPAYIRLFNSLNIPINVINKDDPAPFLCLFIDPEFDESGYPVGGLIVSDLLDVRNRYASPNPAHAGMSNSPYNAEFPGKELYPTAPIVNGYDLTNWAQILAGKRRFLLMHRPRNTMPFQQLHRSMTSVCVDTTLTLAEGEVYTMHVLYKDFETKETMFYAREESFHKQPFSDDRAYVNFYNLSSEGFWSSPYKGIGDRVTSMEAGIPDTTNVFLSHVSVTVNENDTEVHEFIPGYTKNYVTTLVRDMSGARVAPYHSFPIFIQEGEQIHTNSWQYLQFFSMALRGLEQSFRQGTANNPTRIDIRQHSNFYNDYVYLELTDNPRPESNVNLRTPVERLTLPNLLLNVHSGVNNPQTFGSVSSIEYINGLVYLTTIQRTFPAPIYE